MEIPFRCPYETKHSHETVSGQLQPLELSQLCAGRLYRLSLHKTPIYLGKQLARKAQEGIVQGRVQLVLTLWTIEKCPDTKFWYLLLISSKSLFLCFSCPPWVFLSNFLGTQGHPLLSTTSDLKYLFIEFKMPSIIKYIIIFTTMKKWYQINYITMFYHLNFLII